MVKLTDRLKAAARSFRHTPPTTTAGQVKELPFAWPTLVGGKAQWHSVDLSTYISEGFSLNTLVYSAVMYKVRATITAPLRVFSGTVDIPGPAMSGTPLSERIKHPNEYQSWAEFQSRNVVFLNIAGNVYIFIDPKSGKMYSLNPARMYIIPNSTKPAGLAGFLYVPEGKTVNNPDDCIPFLPEDIMHIKLPNPGDPLEGLGYGLSPLKPAAHSVDVDNMITDFLNIFFKRGAMVTGVLKFDVPLAPDVVDTVLERWEEKYGGYKNWQVGVLDRGGSFQRTSLTIEEMGFGEVDSRGESRILGPFGIAPILVGAKIGLERSTYSNYESARQAVWEDTLIPELTLFEVEYQNRFNTPGEFVQFDFSGVPALQRALPRQVNAAYTLVQMGVPPNQALRAAGLRIGDVPGGDVPLMLTGTGQQQGPKADEDESWGQRDDVPD